MKTDINEAGEIVESIPMPINMQFSFKRMEPSLFERIRNDINTICKRISVSRHNGGFESWVQAIETYFEGIGVSQTYYWQEVSARSGNPYIDDVAALFPKKKDSAKKDCPKKWWQIWKR